MYENYGKDFKEVYNNENDELENKFLKHKSKCIGNLSQTIVILVLYLSSCEQYASLRWTYVYTRCCTIKRVSNIRYKNKGYKKLMGNFACKV